MKEVDVVVVVVMVLSSMAADNIGNEQDSSMEMIPTNQHKVQDLVNRIQALILLLLLLLLLLLSVGGGCFSSGTTFMSILVWNRCCCRPCRL